MGRKKNRRGKRKIEIRAEAEAEAEAQANPSFPNIPEEVVDEILSRLPFRSLYRFTCVSKQWRSLISDIIAKITGRKVVLVRSILRSGALTFHSIDEESRVKRVLRRPWKKIKSRYAPVLFGSCNGLLLINIGYDLFLWNPVTQKFKKVLSHKSLADEGYRVVSGLCYDSSTNEYKAVMALCHVNPDYGGGGGGGEFVNVGSLRSKNWRSVRFPYEVDTVKSGPVLNGHLHWYASDENSNHSIPSHQILYFDPHTNQFSKVPMPEPRNGSDGNMIFGLGVLDGCLSMVRHDSPEADSVEVLVMKEYDMQKSWTKLFGISNLALRSYDKLEPLCFTKDGEVLMFMSGSGQSVRVFNPNNSWHKEILVQPYCRTVNVIMYEERWVTPTDYNWEEEELRSGEPTYVHYYVFSRQRKWIKIINARRLKTKITSSQTPS